MTNGKESAFPEVNHDNPQFNFPSYGLSKREYFAGLAMQGLLANSEGRSILSGNNGMQDPALIAEYSINYADALLTELDNPQQP